MPEPELNSDGTVKVTHETPPPVYTPPDIKMGEALPPEFRDKPFFKDKTFVDVIKEHVNLQTLLGQRPAGIPAENAPDEEWNKFIGAIKPKSADEYVFPETEFSKTQKRSPEYEKSVREIMAEAGIPKRQFPKVIEGIEKFLSQAAANQAGKSEDAIKARETEFEGLLDKTYAGEKQAVIDRTKKLMSESVDPALKDRVAGVLKDISNETLFVLTAVLDGVYKKHIAEDDSLRGGDASSADVAALKTEAETIMRSPAYNDWRNPGHDQAKAKVQELFQQVAKLQKV
jgi:hypothetical protein